MANVRFTDEQLDVLINAEGAEEVGTQAWRHGYVALYVVPHEGKFYRVRIPIHPNEGWQTGGSVDGVEVVKREVTKTEWVAV